MIWYERWPEITDEEWDTIGAIESEISTPGDVQYFPANAKAKVRSYAYLSTMELYELIDNAFPGDRPEPMSPGWRYAILDGMADRENANWTAIPPKAA